MKENTKPESQEAPQTLSVREIERLPHEQFEALPQSEKERFFEFMDRDNFPSPAEFYGYASEYDFGPDFGLIEMMERETEEEESEVSSSCKKAEPKPKGQTSDRKTPDDF